MKRKLKQTTTETADNPEFKIDAKYVLYQNQGNGDVTVGGFLIKPNKSYVDFIDKDTILIELAPIVFEAAATVKKLLIKEYMIY